ncbi:MAG: hypothetical protein ACH34V_07400 [Flavobacterium sp.]|uniref:Lipoprotein n=1 Tax=Flavobacterium celericrescens TaxID=2709780 RepID=A0ABX0IDY3_9FLAO|nr:hypothetical protein [Flavobacterium celericrescens]NHM04079.1 hypothetical protein [Flavobacterium celericrescens]
MNKFYIISLLIFSFFSCENIDKKSENESIKKNDFGIENMPNNETEYDTIFTKNSNDNQKLISEIENKLLKSKFRFEKNESIKQNSYNNCEENTIILVKGDGIRNYFAKSLVPEKNSPMKNVYPDFMITVYEFENENIANKNFEIIYNALFSAGHFCNGKAPEKLVQNGNEIFHLSTRAEMFRTYIEKYGELIKNYR